MHGVLEIYRQGQLVGVSSRVYSTYAPKNIWRKRRYSRFRPVQVVLFVEIFLCAQCFVGNPPLIVYVFGQEASMDDLNREQTRSGLSCKIANQHRWFLIQL